MALTDLLSLPVEQLATQFFLPFILIFAILWGLLSVMPIFNRKINIILAVGITILVVNTPYFVLFTSLVSQYIGFTAVIVFGAVLIFGIAKWGFSRGKDIYYETGPSHKRIEKINKEIAKIQKKMVNETDRAKLRADAETIEHLERERRIEAARD